MKNLILLLAFFFLTQCNLEQPATDEDLKNLFLIISFKKSECGNDPGYLPTVVISDKSKFVPAKKDTNACSLAILQQKCPFRNYPLNCYLLLKNLEFDLPKFDNYE